MLPTSLKGGHQLLHLMREEIARGKMRLPVMIALVLIAASIWAGNCAAQVGSAHPELEQTKTNTTVTVVVEPEAAGPEEVYQPYEPWVHPAMHEPERHARAPKEPKLCEAPRVWPAEPKVPKSSVNSHKRNLGENQQPMTISENTSKEEQFGLNLILVLLLICIVLGIKGSR